jgi:hypothetical protein
MTRERLDYAIAEAKRFLAIAKAAREEKINCDDSHCHRAACKRASLDLTMALVNLRKPDWQR